MIIKENDATLADIPPFEVVDNNIVVFFATTRDECEEYINNIYN